MFIIKTDIVMIKILLNIKLNRKLILIIIVNLFNISEIYITQQDQFYFNFLFMSHTPYHAHLHVFLRNINIKYARTN